MSGSFLGIADLWVYVAGTMLVVLLPGPSSLYVLTMAARRGVAAGYRAACGILLGETCLMLAALLGMAALFGAHPILFSLFKYAGSVYVIYLGVTMIIAVRPDLGRRSTLAGTDGSTKDRPADATVSGHALRQGFIVASLNPKGILFWMVFPVQFVDPSYEYKVVPFAILGLIAQTLSISYLSALIFGGAKLAAAFGRRRRLASGLTGGAGALFLGFGAKLATTSIG